MPHFIDWHRWCAASGEIVVHNGTIERHLLNAGGVGRPHVQAGSALPLTKLLLEEPIQGFPLVLLPEPQRFAALQVADHGHEFSLLPVSLLPGWPATVRWAIQTVARPALPMPIRGPSPTAYSKRLDRALLLGNWAIQSTRRWRSGAAHTI